MSEPFTPEELKAWKGIRCEAETFTKGLENEKNVADEWRGFEQRTQKEAAAPEKKERKKSREGWLDGRPREVLPIDERLAEIHALIERHQVVLVQADTGAGKTTRICQYELLARAGRSIIMTQTRRNAVRWNGKRIAQEMGSAPGGVVGWRLFGEEPKTSANTRLTLVVDQSLTNKVRRDGRLPAGLLIIDEAHERSIPTDLLLGLIKEYLPQSPDTKILITSATIDTEKFSKFFDDAPVASVIGRCFPVKTEPLRLSKFEHHSQGAGRAAGELIKKLKEEKLSIPSDDGGKESPIDGGVVLVLLPGKEDIRNVIADIKREAKNNKLENRVTALSCHGESTAEEQDAIHTPLKSGELRFVVGTEVLRSSVTVAHTIGVIDSLQIKRLITDAQGVGHLDKIAVSKAEAQQGRGRAGRTQPGLYIPVSFDSEYEGLSAYPTPAILQEPISNVVLQVAAIGRSARNFAFIDPLPGEKLETAIKRLQRLGALDNEEKITLIGEILVQFPLDPERAKALLVAEKLGVLPETIIAVSMERSPFFMSREKQEWTIEEPLLRQVLARLKKEEVHLYSRRTDVSDQKPSIHWSLRRSEDLLDAATVDINDLPDWIKKQKEGWSIDLEELPVEKPVKWLVWLARRFWAKESENDFAAFVHLFRAYKAEEDRLADSQPPNKGGGKKISAYKWRQQQLSAWCERWFVNQKLLSDAERVMQEIANEVHNSPLTLDAYVTVEREFDPKKLATALAAGLVDSVAARAGGGHYTSPLVGNDNSFQLAHESACSGSAPLIISGGVRKIPTIRQRFFYLSESAAPLDWEDLIKVAPQLCSEKLLDDAAPDTYSTDGTILQTKLLLYGSQEIAKERVLAEHTPENARQFSRWFESTPTRSWNNYPELIAIRDRNDLIMFRIQKLLSRLPESAFGHLRQYTREQISLFYQNALAGAQSLAEIKAVNTLKLPEPNEEEIKDQEAQYPEYITLLGGSYRLEYVHSTETGEVVPSIVFAFGPENAARILSLPEDPIVLPSGLTVDIGIAVKIGWHNLKRFTTGSMRERKQGAIEVLEQGMFEAAAQNNKEPLVLGDLTNPESAVPPIAPIQFGSGIMTGQPLMAYRALVAKITYENHLDANTVWYRTREEAEVARTQSIETVANFNKVEQQKIREQEALQQLIDHRREISYELLESRLATLPKTIADRALHFQDRSLFPYNRSIEEIERLNEEAARILADIHDPSRWPTLEQAQKKLENKTPIMKTQEPPGFGENPFAKFVREQQDPQSPKKEGEKIPTQSQPVAPKSIERQVMTEALRRTLKEKIERAKSLADIAWGTDESVAGIKNVEKIKKIRLRAGEIKRDSTTLTQELANSDDADRMSSRVEELLRKAEKDGAGLARLQGLHEKWPELYQEMLTLINRIAKEQEVEITDAMLAKIRPQLLEIAQRDRNYTPGDLNRKLEEIFVESL